ncbi:type II secretion system minor pseudopilin GspK [Geothermobacter ehrlichii]|uniref:type II secretion system minor pseudopilin GspK n=1 Tax=Geothermobacter ehrlichii TaxID=213224 RepID=UPI0016530BB5|nr:type II secretion system minor pseudopilin GspK [Geothermobacter ehrlichii]
MRNESGFALLLVLVIVALLSALVSDFAFSTLVDLRLAETFRDSARASSLARGGVTVARELLRQDNNGWDAPESPDELWALPMEQVPVDDGFVSLRIRDLDGRIGLNRLVDSLGNPNVVMVDRFRRLCDELGLDRPEALTDALIDWLDRDSDPRPEGAEDPYYLALPNPYQAADAPLENLDELRRVRGFDARTLARLRPYVSARGGEKLNVNSAPAEVLLAWDGEMRPEAAETIIAERRKKPFRTLDEIRELIGVETFSALNRNLDLDVGSRYFHVDSRAEIGDGNRRIEAVIDRKTDRILWQKVN